MKQPTAFLVFLMISRFTAAVAAVPLSWTSTPSTPTYMPPSIPHGSTIELSVSLRGFSEPAIAPGADVRLWFQTNGMGSTWFSAPASFVSNVVTATFGPAQDIGADRVNCFLGAPSNVFATAVLRLTHAPGFTPSMLDLPAKRIDFGAVDVFNAPWPTVEDVDARDAQTLATAKAYTDAHTSPPSQITDGTNTIGADLSYRIAGDVITAVELWSESSPGVKREIADTLVWNGSRYVGTPGNEWYSELYYDGELARWVILYSQYLEMRETEWEDPVLPFGARSEFGMSYKALYTPSGRVPVTTRIATTNDIPRSASEVGAFPASAGTQLQSDIDRVYTLMAGGSAYMQITNYLRTVNGVVPTLSFWDSTNGVVDVNGERMETNLPWKVYSVAEEVMAWTDRTKAEMSAETDSKLEQKAPRGWAGTTSRTGEVNPLADLYTMITTPYVLLSGGSEYTCVVSNSIWVLTARNAEQVFSPGEGGIFKICDSEGNSLFEISKTDAEDAPAIPGGICASGNVITIPFRATAQPVMGVSTGSLTNWVEETSADFPHDVTWSNEGRELYIATITLSGAPRAAFFRAKFVREGMTAIKHTAGTTFDGGIYLTTGGTTTRYRIKPRTINGELVLGLEAW